MRRGEAGLSSPVRHPGAAVGKGRSDGPSHVAFWLRPVSLFGRFGVTSPASLHVRSAFHVSPGRALPRGWQSCRRCPRSFTPWVTPQHVRVGAPKHHRVRPGCPDRHSSLDPCNTPHSGVLENRECFWSHSSPSANTPSQDSLFPRVDQALKPAECGLSREIIRISSPGVSGHFECFRPLSGHFLRRNRTTIVLVRMLEIRQINMLSDHRRVEGSKGARSGAVDWERTVRSGTDLRVRPYRLQ
jgi:hypothetical protein